ncbi:alpha/beta hydrolase [Streptomyces longwoodensis]|uniref:alpha/beta fold hydrolase n=1 Tax=Streptomyces longwoodensis TaxID=68231 RepID=UPI003402B8C4
MAPAATAANPEIGATISAHGIETNYHDTGSGSPVLLLHGSGPGVSAWANWRLTMPVLAKQHRVLAPDLVGFGYTERPDGAVYDKALWQAHILGFLDALGLERVSIVGNSYGGGLAMALAINHPERVDKLVLMGSAALHFEITPALDEIWGLKPTVPAMRRALDLFAWDRTLVSDELAEVRHRAFARPGVYEAYAAMFPEPRQRWVDAMASDPDDVARVQQPTLVIHGRDDQVVPVSASLEIFDLLPHAQLHVFGRCGHWSQLEYASEFAEIVASFLAASR